MKNPIVFPLPLEENKWEFTLWAPEIKDVKLELENGEKYFELEKGKFGYWKTIVQGLEPGLLYKYKLNKKSSYPDPASLSQPEGVHGPSELINLKDYKWTDQEWKNIPLKSMIQYELHTGTFSQEGNFEAIISKLDYLKNLGINTIEILPVASFSGKRNWGYDGVYPYAVHDSYGGAFKLMELVNACHKNGIAVILDVVYNHLGPEGNYLSKFGPYFSGKYSTPWGKPVNFDDEYSDGVRNFFIQNALMWCRDFHIDGLRLDAVHAIYDFSAKHFMQELAENLKNLSVQTGKDYYLIAESNLNDVRYINPISRGGYGLDAQWSDDFHHSLHALVTDEKKGYYMDFGAENDLSKSIKDAFVFDGKYSEYRKKTYGNRTHENKGEQFVIFSQNHDQTGNRKLGERLISLSDFETAKLIAGTMFVTPNIPMLFMGEEYGERNPFYYFVSHLDPELNKMVKEGREREFKDFHDKRESPDPSSVETYKNSQLSWNIQGDPEKSAMFNFYKEMIHLRKNNKVLKEPDRENMEISNDAGIFKLERWQENKRIICYMNYNSEKAITQVSYSWKGDLKKILDSADTLWRGPGSPSSSKISQADKLEISGKSIVIYSN